MFWTDSTNWKSIANEIREGRKMPGDTVRPIPSDISGMFLNMQEKLRGVKRENGKFVKTEISFDERKDICELLFELYLELNTLKPLGRNYKKCFDSGLIDTFIKTFKMANDYNGQSFSYYGPHIISWLEDYKKTYLNGKTMNPIDKTR